MADDSEKVIFLAFDNPKLERETEITLTRCANCKNKTFLLVHHERSDYPMLRCCACGDDVGRIGHVGRDD